MVYNQLEIDYDVLGWGIVPAGCVVYVRLHNARLDIYHEIKNIQQSPKALKTLEMHMAQLGTEDLEQEQDILNWLDAIAVYAMPALRKLVTPPKHMQKITLADLQKSDYYICHLEYLDEIAQVGPIRAGDLDEEDCDTPAELYPTTSLTKHAFPLVPPRNVEVLYDDPAALYQQVWPKVLVDGNILFWKPSYSTMETQLAVEKFARIRDSGLSTSELPVPRLYGIVMDENNLPRGQLYHWIDVSRQLTWDAVEKASAQLREKWALQVRHIVADLHCIGVVWGDVKAGNVVLDQLDNVVILDFEGGATKGWVEQHHMETFEGDLQGLERLVGYILDDESPLRSREKERDADWDSMETDSVCNDAHGDGGPVHDLSDRHQLSGQ